MKKVLVILMLFFTFGCSDDANDPSENSIIGQWKTTFTSEQIADYDNLILDLRTDGNCFSTISTKKGKVETQDNAYTYDNGILTIKSQDCEGAEGKYTVIFRDNGIEFKLLDDECGRNIFFISFFEKYIEPQG